MSRSFFQVLTSTKEIEMWGDGKQTRSFTYIDDCVEGILRVTKSDFKEPLNVGSSEMVGSNLSNLHVDHDSCKCMCSRFPFAS
jgi:nucleoside-diphosphate-sugar epimerase